MRQPKSVEFPKLRIAMLPENIFRTRVAWGAKNGAIAQAQMSLWCILLSLHLSRLRQIKLWQE